MKLFTNAGVFPAKKEICNKFSALYLEDIKNVDLLCKWNNIGENFISKFFCSKAKVIDNSFLEPYYFMDNPWSYALKGKKVLVIHPLSETIVNQYDTKRNKLFPNIKILPKFDLKVIKAVQSLDGKVRDEFTDWFDALDYMKNQINKIDFDVCIIGAGAYGLPLAGYVKKIGKQAIHIGGATQILFGIKGERWSNMEIISEFFNENWVFPKEEDKPEGYKNIEGGCYW